jgi:hypothetical protein
MVWVKDSNFLEFSLKYNSLSKNDKDVLPFIKQKHKNFVPKKNKITKPTINLKEYFVPYPTRVCITLCFVFGDVFSECFRILEVSDGACSVF